MRCRTAALGGIVLVALLVGSCRKRAVPCHGEIDRDDLYRMQQLIMEGEDVCPEHVAPRIEADGSGVRLNGRVLAGGGALPSGSMRKIDPLFTELKMSREIWKQLHVTKAFEAHATVVIGGEVDAIAGMSVLQTAAYAGYPRMRVECAGIGFETYWAVPQPPGFDVEGPAQETMRVVRGNEGWYALGFPDRKPRPVDSHARDLSGLLSSVQEACADRSGACARVLEIETNEGSFADVARVAWALMQSPAFGRRLPTLRLKGPGA